MTGTQFKSFVFPHNPETITVSVQERASVQFCPGYGDIVRPMGRHARRIRCTGCFVGDNFDHATSILRQWESACAENPEGTLMLPGFSPFTAVLTDCVFEERGDGRVLLYTMSFLEQPEVV